MTTTALAPTTIVQIDTRIAELSAEVARIEAILGQARKVLAVETDKYEGWSRYYLVTGGHLHASTNCSTCFVTTEFQWLTDLSGLSRKEIVELAGERACTVCFPDAPVEARERKSVLFTDEEKAAEAARQERAAKAAEKATKEVLDPETGKQLFKTERSAEIELGNKLEGAHRSLIWEAEDADHRAQLTTLAVERADEAKKIAAALAAKRGVTVEEIFAAKLPKVAAAVVAGAKSYNKGHLARQFGEVEVPTKDQVIEKLQALLA
ncbi:hypothetical protein SEA_PUPPER_201 [Gordonia phage Pupper]|uniref:Uncharacterized protein n=1 Tax=Gordonia phage Pupper TaxID=2571249 RepID=A0A4Y6EKW7_9CAUD|nr:hypothetical protein KHQ83_gp076 [Gordonia phage Pupper]QDF18687.1 hypothetical protein SEA_PUPPER_201 [Gordonia phage Pupper]QDF18919.1 hypothetical protein SEA_SCENTAE_200 [Gordonia phage SCentae]